MSIILVGGGPDTVTTPVVFDRFVTDVRARAGGSRPPRIAVVLFDREGSSEYFLPAYLEPLQNRVPCDVTMIAPQRALAGGYRIRGTEVCSAECSEGLDELDVRDGLGLVPFAVDVHAAQAGTLSRAVGAVAEGLVDRAVAVDENTALVLRHADLAELEVIGAGNCWTVRGSGSKVTVAVLAAG